MEQEKIATGIAGLDRLLRGGLLPDASVMVEGTPGTGKSTFGMQFIAAGVMSGQPGVLVTLEEYPSEFYRDAVHFGWDFRKWEDEDKARVIATSPEALIQQMQVGGPLSEEIHTIGAKRIVVDSVTHFERISTDPTFLRNTMSTLIHTLKMEDLLSMFTKDFEPGGYMEFWGRYSVDVLIELTSKLLKDRERHRYIEIHKARGQNHVLGKHTFRITPDGVQIFPRAEPRGEAEVEPPTKTERMSSGIEGFDQMLGGGIIRSQSTLIAGTAGTGKSLISLYFAHAGSLDGQNTLYITMEDPPGGLIRNAASVGMDLSEDIESGKLEMVYLPPVELSPDELLYEVESRLKTGKYQRLVIDSVSTLIGVTPEPIYLRDVVHALTILCYRLNIAGYFVAEIEEMTGPFRFTEFGGSFIADTVVLLRQIEVGGELKKAISVIKMRASHHDPSLRELIFTDNGLKVGERFENMAGLLTGTPTAQRPIGIEPYLGELPPERQHIIGILTEHKEATAKEVAQAADMDVHRVTDMLEGLTDLGFVAKRATEGEVRYRAALMKAK